MPVKNWTVAYSTRGRVGHGGPVGKQVLSG
jgi:hypothetical protein